MRHTTRLAHPEAVLSSSICTVDVALDYARRGWRILPLHAITLSGVCTCGSVACRSLGRHIRIPNGVKDATTDQEVIRNWWQKTATTQVGVATGDGLLVIEIDVRRGGSLEKFVNFYALADTTLMQTRGGGWQLYFSYNPALVIRNTRDALGTGISTRGDGSFVVPPATRDASGKPFSWLDDWQPARLPSVLLPPLLSTTLNKKSWSTTTKKPSPAAYSLAQSLVQHMS
jgi:hypothetical protein